MASQHVKGEGPGNSAVSFTGMYMYIQCQPCARAPPRRTAHEYTNIGCDSSCLLAAVQPTNFSSGSDGSSPQQSSGYCSACIPSSFAPPPETYSRKVFVGGLPPDIHQGEVYYKLRLTGHA